MHFIASNFNILNVDYGVNLTALTTIKQLNPNIIILMYMDIMASSAAGGTGGSWYNWTTVNSNENWFVHTTSGARVVDSTYGWYAMNVGNTGWQTYYATRAAQIIAKTPAISGIFADDVWTSFPSGSYPDSYWNPWTVPNADINQSIGNNWYANMLAMITYVKTVIPNSLFVLNTGDSSELVNAADGKWDEAFVSPHYADYPDFLSVADWQSAINEEQTICQSGKIELVCGGCLQLETSSSWCSANAATISNLLQFCFASYLLGASGTKSYFNFGTFWDEDGSNGYYSIFDTAQQLGAPTDTYFATSNIFARNFEYGEVLVNPSSTTYTYNLGATYTTIEGQNITSITLNGYSGAILLNP